MTYSSSQISRTIGTLAVLVVACLASKNDESLQKLRPKCIYTHPKGNPSLWEIDKIANVGSLGGYFYSNIGKGKVMEGYPADLTFRCFRADEWSDTIFEMSTFINSWGYGPRFLGCHMAEVKNVESICFVYERITMISEDYTKFKSESKPNFKKVLAQLMTLARNVNLKGYYYNNIRPTTIGRVGNGPFKLIDPDFMISISSSTKVIKPTKWARSTDAPSQFTFGGPQKSIDDLYSMSLAACIAILDGGYDDYMLIKKEETENKQDQKDCYYVRDAECNRYVSRTVAKAVHDMPNSPLGKLSTDLDKFKDGIYASSVANWGTINKASVFADLNMVTLLRDLWAYDNFPLNGEQFMELFELATKKGDLI